MVKLDVFDIQLDQRNGCYYAGHVISGALLTSCLNPLQLNELRVTLKGESRTNWVEKVSDNIYDSYEPYLNESKIIVANGSGHEPSVLTPGSHAIPFHFRLPVHLPSSYEGEYGYVRYGLVARACLADGSIKGKEIVIDRPITVFASVALRQLTAPNDRGLSKEDVLEMVSCCGSSGQLSAVLSIAKSAFLVGQTMPIRIDIENLTKKSQPPISITFVQDTHFRSVSLFQSAHDQKTVSRVIDCVRIDSPGQGKVTAREVGVRIPVELPPTSIGNSLITVRYKVRMEMGRQCDIVLPVGVATKV